MGASCQIWKRAQTDSNKFQQRELVVHRGFLSDLEART